MRSSDLAAAVLLGCAATGIAQVRPPLAAQYHEAEVTSDVYTLPAPEHVVAASLGYRAALADLLFAHTLVSYGIHIQERRRFEFVGALLETVSALDPSLRDTYYYADTLLTLSAKPEKQDYYKAREIQARGLEARPYDSELWLVSGQFVAFLGPGFLKDPEERREWREAGARLMMRACDLYSGDPGMAKKCVGVTRLLDQKENRAAIVRFFERQLAITDDPKIRAGIEARLRAFDEARQLQEQVEAVSRLRDEAARSLPFVSRDTFALLHPSFEPERCAGPGHAGDPECATDWQAWQERQAQALELVGSEQR